MHYGPNTFSKSSQLETIKSLKKKVNMGQRQRLSRGDIRQTNKMYHCPGIV
jgi:tolkin protein